MVVDGILVELLLTVVLTFNIGAYSFLWYKIRRVEEQVDENREQAMTLFKRIFGIEEDETNPGHLVETEQRFDAFDDRFDHIEDKIDTVQKENRKSHEETRDLLENITQILIDEESIDADESDIKGNR